MIIKKKKRATEQKNTEKIDSLRGIIEEVEKSLYSAKAMLSRLEGEKKPSIKKKTYGANPDGKVVEGIFDGQIMIGNDGKQYPVPANYASKSKLVEGDMLKLTITDDGNFVYKQIGPVERKRLIGIVKEDESGNHIIYAENKIYKVLLASITYYKAKPGDEVTIIIPKIGEPVWSSIENVIKKNAGISDEMFSQFNEEQDPFTKEITSEEKDAKLELETKKEKTVDDLEDKENKEKEEKKEKKLKKEKVTKIKINNLEKEEAEKEKIIIKKKKKIIIHPEPKKGDLSEMKKTEVKNPSEKMKEIINEWAPKLSQLEKEAGKVEEEIKTPAFADSYINQDKEEKVNIKINSGGGYRRNNFPGQDLVNKDFPDTPEEIFSPKF